MFHSFNLQVLAVDADTEEFGIRYSIVDLPTSTPRNSSFSSSTSKRDSSYFEISSESGEVRLRMSDQDIIKFMKVTNQSIINTKVN